MSSVPSWLRNESKTDFIWKLYKFAIYLGEVIEKHPKKYRFTYGDRLIAMSLKALSHARIGNKIRLFKGMDAKDFKSRRKHLKKAKSIVDTIPTVAYIYLELTSKIDGAKKDKIIKQEETIGIEASDISKMIAGVLKHDRAVFDSK